MMLISQMGYKLVDNLLTLQKTKIMLSKSIEKALNSQIKIEAESSQIYLAMACWAEVKGLEGIAGFMYKQSQEERDHMLKLIKFVNERGGHAQISELSSPHVTFGSFKEMFENLFEHEVKVSKSGLKNSKIILGIGGIALIVIIAAVILSTMCIIRNPKRTHPQ